jgi:CDP-diacylglycerol--glycerol-3-phosphate 3-phosphatidyltransferase
LRACSSAHRIVIHRALDSLLDKDDCPLISIYQLKPRFQNLLRPLVQRLFDRGITANQVTLGACAISLVVGGLAAVFAAHAWVFALIPLWMIVRMALNAIDGMLAREFGQKSRLGAYLNELTDVIADSALFLPFALLPEVNLVLVVLVTLLAIFSEYAGVLGPMVGASRRYDGPMGKSDRAFCFGVLGAGVAIGWLSALWINGVLAVIAALLVYTLINRIRRGLEEVSSQADAPGE